MTLSRDLVQPGMLDEYRAFEVLVRAQSDAGWTTPTRCDGWTVADVAGHVIGQLTDVVNLRLEDLGSPEATARQVGERAGRPPGELADELAAGTESAATLAAAFDDASWDAPIAGSTVQSLGFGLESLWFDTYLHADDMRAAIGQQTTETGGLAPSVSHIAQILTDQGWDAATLSLDDLPVFEVSGGGRTISGPAMPFILVATGRADPAALGLDSSVNIYR
jgi:uncharacterized protein (TIGR03083 family)